MRSTVVDTNVLVVANGRDGVPSIACQLAAIETLSTIKARGRVGLDELGEIIDEYRRYCRGSGQPGVGDEFFRWVFDHRYTDCEVVSINSHDDRVYEEFPAVADLGTFDRADRKFIAVALACSPKAEVVNAVDGGYELHAAPLRRIGIHVREVCPEHVGK